MRRRIGRPHATQSSFPTDFARRLPEHHHGRSLNCRMWGLHQIDKIFLFLARMSEQGTMDELWGLRMGPLDEKSHLGVGSACMSTSELMTV